MKHQTTACSLAVLVAVAGLAAGTIGAGAQTAPERAWMPANDAEFVRALDAANTAELDAAKYVVNRTKEPAVHQFAQHMIDDHSTTAVKLEAVTRGTNLRPAPRDEGGLPFSGARMLLILQADSGPQLDSDFMRMQVPVHRRALGLLQWESENGTVTNLKNLATGLIPTVQQHLQIAQNYLASHNLTPYSPPEVLPVPGNVNPGNRGAGPGPGIPNNPASSPNNGGSTGGQNNGTQPSAPAAGASPGPIASPAPSASP